MGKYIGGDDPEPHYDCDHNRTNNVQFMCTPCYEATFDVPKTGSYRPTLPAPPEPTPDLKIKTASSKVPLSLIPLRALKGVARVFGYGAKKYAKGNFLLGTDEEAAQRYTGGGLRHLADCQNLDGTFDYASMAKLDGESGLPEIDHLICGLVMLRAIMIKRGAMVEDPGIGNEPPK